MVSNTGSELGQMLDSVESQLRLPEAASGQSSADVIEGALYRGNMNEEVETYKPCRLWFSFARAI